MFDETTLLLYKLLRILVIVAFVAAKMLFAVQLLDRQMNDQVLDGPFIVFLGAGNVNG